MNAGLFTLIWLCSNRSFVHCRSFCILEYIVLSAFITNTLFVATTYLSSSLSHGHVSLIMAQHLYNIHTVLPECMQVCLHPFQSVRKFTDIHI